MKLNTAVFIMKQFASE